MMNTHLFVVTYCYEGDRDVHLSPVFNEKTNAIKWIDDFVEKMGDSVKNVSKYDGWISTVTFNDDYICSFDIFELKKGD
jgi:hypothetical protein